MLTNLRVSDLPTLHYHLSELDDVSEGLNSSVDNKDSDHTNSCCIAVDTMALPYILIHVRKFNALAWTGPKQHLPNPQTHNPFSPLSDSECHLTSLT